MAARSLWLPITGVLLLALALRLIVFSGFGGTDDVTYASRGLELAQGDWRFSTNVTELRFGVSLPIAALSLVLGKSDLALTAWSLLCSLLDVAAVCWLSFHLFGRRVGLVAGLLMAVVPLHLTMAGRALADAPFAAFATLAFAAFIRSAEKSSRRISVVAGIAAGACWWIKPTASVPLFVALALAPLVLWRWDNRWWWIVAACAATIVAEWVMLWATFGTPWLTLGLLVPFLREHGQYTGDPFWGEGSPWFYYRRFLLDGRELWVLPYLLLASLGTLLLSRRAVVGDEQRQTLRLLLYWAGSLLAVYSFFVISLNPIKLIPKQENYAVLFVAPLVLLTALGLARWRTPALVAALAAFALGGLVLAGLQQQEHRAKYSRLAQSADKANRASDAVPVYVSSQTLSLAKLRALQSGTSVSSALQPWAALDGRAVAPGAVAQTGAVARQAPQRDNALFVAESASAELALPATRALFSLVRSCGQYAGQIEAAPDSLGPGFGYWAATGVAVLRSALPPRVDRQLTFTDAVIKPVSTPVFRLSATCPPAG